MDVMRRIDPSEAIYGHRNRLTVLRVRLNPAGELIEAAVEQSSGIAALDHEAVLAMTLAQPFQHPPLQLATGGEIRFRFGFRYEVERSSAVPAVTGITPDAGSESADGGAG
jgi:TonB family protein